MVRFFWVLALFLSLVVAGQVQSHFVWQVNKDGKTLYLAGTLHLLPAEQYPLPAAFNFAYQQATEVIFEAKLPDAYSSEEQQRMLSVLRYSDEDSLVNKLSAATWQKLVDYFAPFGLSPQQLKSMKPGMVSVLMMMFTLQQAGLHGQGVDAYFVDQAQSDGKKQAFLESTTFQLQMLSELGQSNPEQFILANLSQLQDYKPQFLAMMQAWRLGQTDEFEQLVIKPMQQEDPITYQSLLVERNQTWISRILVELDDAETELVLVGAAHLVGNEGLLKLLAQPGISIKQLTGHTF